MAGSSTRASGSVPWSASSAIHESNAAGTVAAISPVPGMVSKPSARKRSMVAARGAGP